MNNILSFEPKTILCPVDFSELSDLAIKYAAVGAIEYDATLTVMHAATFELPRYFSRSETDHLIQEIASAKESVRDHLTRHVKTVLGDAFEELHLEFEVVETHPVGAILEWSEKYTLDLIVLGTHGLGGVKRLLLGSVAKGIVENSKVPVFTIRQKIHDFIDVSRADVVPRIERILCPCNTKEVSRASLKTAVSLAERFNAKLTVLFIDETKEHMIPSRSGEKFSGWVAETVKTQCDLEPVVRQGNSAEEIIAQAIEEKEDLIVLGAQHQSFREATFFGRTTDLVVRHAPIPVLVIPRFSSP